MANKTVYPYGTGGSLPSSIGIINDLTTGGVDKALSAEQGVVLNNLIGGGQEYYVPVEAGRHIQRIINASNVWTSVGTNHDSVQINVVPGQKYQIVGNASQTGYYAFLKNYSSGSSAPVYAAGYAARIAIAANGTVDITIPSDCTVLYICIKNSGTVQVPQGLYLVEKQSEHDVKEVSEELSDLGGVFNEMVDFDEISVSSTDASYISITKDEYGGILIKNLSKAAGKYALIGLPSSLVIGQKYELSFKYKADFSTSGNWFLRIVTSTYAETQLGVNLYPTGNSTDYATAKFTFTHDTGYAYLRLAGNSQNNLATVYIKDYSISNNKTDVASLATRVYNLENGISTFTGYSYQGDKIVLNPTYKYSVEQLASNATKGQSAALYDKYLFIVTDKFTSVILYNMETRASVYTWTTGQSVDTWHCNQSSFGTEKYDSSDLFPVLYISQRPDSGSTRGIVQAYRIIPTVTNNNVTSFTMTLVQSIYLPEMTTQNALGLPNATIDTENGYMWTYSRDTNGNGLATFTKFAIPALSSSTVTLNDSSILDSFQDDWAINNNQGAFIRAGKMYMMRGVPAQDHFCECNVIDLYFKKKRVSRIDLYPNGFSYEPQGCFNLNDTICFTINGTGIYRINLS